jgi:site-specific DNA recombinase
MERPALQRLLSDIAEGHVDTVVVYKVDRLTPSLADFAKMVELFDRHGVSFVAVTQQFNTTTSMGRLTLNILLSFAQFEREVTGERIRDKIAASKRKGLWMGGVTPLGYEVRDRKLVTVPAETEAVRSIYTRYLELGSVRLLKQDLDRREIRSKARLHRDGSRTGGSAFSRGALYALLSNPIYVGEIAHRDARYPGRHEAIVDRTLWEAVQLKLDEQGPGSLTRARKTAPSPLVGKLFDSAGNKLTPSHATKNGRQYRYYISTALMTGTRDETGGWRLPAPQLEAVVADGAARCLADRAAIAAALEEAGIAPNALAAALKAADDQQGRLRSEADRAEALSALIDRVELDPHGLRLVLSLAPLVSHDTTRPKTALLTVTRDIPLRIKRRGVEMRLVIENAHASTSKPDPILLKEVARAYRCFDAFLTGKVGSMAELPTCEAVDERYVRRLLPLAFLAPEIIQAIVSGNQPVDLTARKLIRGTTLALDWQTQKQVLGFR